MADIHLEAGDAGRTVGAAAGDTLVVTLSESPSTGRIWSARSSDAAVLRPRGDAFDRSGPLIPGAGGTRQFRFLAAGAGTATLAFALAYAATGTTTDEWSIEVVVR